MWFVVGVLCSVTNVVLLLLLIGGATTSMIVGREVLFLVMYYWMRRANWSTLGDGGSLEVVDVVPTLGGLTGFTLGDPH